MKGKYLGYARVSWTDRTGDTGLGMLWTSIESLPTPVFLVDARLVIHECNVAARECLSVEKSAVIMRRGGDALHCIHAAESAGGCGGGACCRNCVIRTIVTQALMDRLVVRHRARLDIKRDGAVLKFYALLTASLFDHSSRPLVVLMIEDLREMPSATA